MLPEMILTGRDDPAALAETLTHQDIEELVSLLSEKADELRYAALLTLCARSDTHADVYPNWSLFAEKIGNENSYQRSIGLILTAHNVKWDMEHHFDNVIEAYLSHCQDEKFITSRQAIQNIPVWAPYAKTHLTRTAEALMRIDIPALKDSQRKLILLDILHALISIRRVQPTAEIDVYIHHALTGGLLDKKSMKEIQGLL